jgi:Zn-dependent peptidase ImmA (M78 family)/transcriptional regulator with XRE-family HTH domain
MSTSAAAQWVNPDVLGWARKRLNLTREQVSEESKKLARRFYSHISPHELAAWEDSKGEPDLRDLETLAEIYVCPVGYFFLEQTPREHLPMTFRGLAKDRESLSPITHRTLERFSELAHWTVDLLRKTEQSWPVRIRPGEAESQYSAADTLALEYRQRFGWTTDQRRQFAGKPKEAFRWWRRVIEAQGVFCFEMRLDSKDVRGAALWCEDYPFILVNHEDVEAAAGRIFTLLHEYGHLVGGKEGLVCDFRGISHDHNPEPFANRFAARMLLQPEELRERLNQLDEQRYRGEWPDALLDRIRKPFPVSRDVMAILLQELNLAPKGSYERKRRQWESRRPYGRGGRRLPQREEKLREVGYSLTRVLARSAARPAFSWMDAASVLGMKVEKTEQFLSWAGERAA